MLRVPLRVGEVLNATVRRKLSAHRVLISLRGRTLVAEPEQNVIAGDEILVQVLAVLPRIRLRLLNGASAPRSRPPQPPLDLLT